jgi:hypothetical protein
VCLRLARIGDRRGVEELLRKADRPVEEFELARLLRADPRRMVVIVATGFADGGHRVLGFGAIEIRQDAAQPALLVVDEQRTEGLDQLLCDALAGRARAVARRRAA